MDAAAHAHAEDTAHVEGGQRSARAALLGSPPAPVDACVIGCGNLLRGDDAAGPIVIRRLWEAGAGDHARLVDGGTAGMDVAFKMRGARRVVLIDACRGTGEPAGTLFRVPGEVIADVPPPADLHSHAFRWDHSLSFAKWLLGDEYPDAIEVWLIQGESFVHGDGLSPAVERAVDELAARIARELRSGIDPAQP